MRNLIDEIDLHQRQMLELVNALDGENRPG